MSSQQSRHSLTEAGKFPGESPAQQETMTVVIEAESGREAQCPVGRQVPGNYRSQVMGGVWQPEAVAVAESAIHFNSGDKVFAAQIAVLGGSLKRKRPARADGVAELPRIAAGEILYGKRIDGEVPSLVSAGEQQLELEFVIDSLTGECIGRSVIGFHVVALDFFHDLVGFADLLVLEVENGVDDVLRLQQANTIFPAEAGEDCAVVESALAVEIELSGPPGGGSVFEFGPVGDEVSSAALCTESGEVFDLEVARFFQVMIIGDEVWAFLSRSERRKQDHRE